MNFNFKLVIDFSISSDGGFDFFIINPGNRAALSYCSDTSNAYFTRRYCMDLQ